MNQTLQYQQIRSAYMTKILDDLNMSTSEYVGYVTQIKVLTPPSELPSDLVGLEARTAARLAWRANELSIILEGKTQALYVRKYQLALTELRVAVEKPPSADDTEIEEKTLQFMQASYDLGGALAKLAHIKFD